MTAPIPTQVSGPNQLSKRTDAGQPLRHIANAKYGEDRDFIAQQKAAPLADGPDRPQGAGVSSLSSEPAAGPPSAGMASPAPPIVPLSAPSQNPGQHVTTGMQTAGPRQRPELKPDQLSQALAPYFAADDTGTLGFLAWQLAEMGL
jgi:hypothetical protein